MQKKIKELYSKTASIGCIICLRLGYGETPAEIHHIRRFGGKRDLAPVIPLCPEHHRGKTGVHGLGKKAFADFYGVDEEGLLEQVEEILNAPNN